MISIGVDGGGTKTAFLGDINGKTASFTLREPANPNTVGYQQSVETIKRGINRICDENGFTPDDIDGIFCGIAGATSGDYRSYCADELKELAANAEISVAHDGHNILSAAFGNQDGTIVICGTGSSCFVRKNGELFRIGGYLTFDMAGCGYEIGRAAVAHALSCFDGRAVPGVLNDMVCQQMGMPPLDALDLLLKSDRQATAAYAVTVYKAYQAGDTAAKAILETNMSYIADYINAAARHFDGKFSVCMAGSVGVDPISIGIIKQFLKCDAEIFPLSVEPVCGALVIAKNNAERRNNK